MKKIIRLTESDLTRIVKRILKEQSTTQDNKYIGKTFNIYRDPQNTGLIGQNKILSFEVSDDIHKEININIGYSNHLIFNCKSPNELTHMINDTKLYSNNLTNSLKKDYCSTSTGGTSVPKADFAQGKKSSTSDFA